MLQRVSLHQRSVGAIDCVALVNSTRYCGVPSVWATWRKCDGTATTGLCGRSILCVELCLYHTWLNYLIHQHCAGAVPDCSCAC